MPHIKKTLFATCFILAMGTLMIISAGDAFDAARQIQKSSAGEISAPLDEILRYISSGWGSLTRSLDYCEAFEDVKAEGKSILYFPAGMPIPPASRELKDRCSIGLENLPMKISRIGANGNSCQTSPPACSIWKIRMSCPVGASMKCTVGTVILSFVAFSWAH